MSSSSSEQRDIDNYSLHNETSEYLTFHLDNEEYGIEIMRVQGIQCWTNVTAIPNTPEYILGVINLRGQIVPIIDLRLRFSLEKNEFDTSTVVIVIKLVNNGEEKLIGIVVDGVSETYQFSKEAIQYTTQLSNTYNTEFLKGFASVEEKLVILLDIDHLIDVDDIIALNDNKAA